MRMVHRNRQTAYYQLYVGETEDKTDDYYNGNRTIEYGEKTEFRAYIYDGRISAMSDNQATYQHYGVQDSSQVSIFMQKDLGINTKSVLWIGDTDKANYIVTSVTKNIRGIVIRARELT